MDKDIVTVILSGGAGTRLWPLSREMFPKQLQKLYSPFTLLQETAKRYPTNPVVVCNEAHRFIVAEQLREIGITPLSVMVEPCARNTAPAVAVAALLHEQNPDTLILVMPSDHMVVNGQAFRQAVEQAATLARQGQLVTFGIHPTSAHTGYGYIHRGAPLSVGFQVERFVEKPEASVAEAYCASGEYYWNSGIFLFKAGAYLAELNRLRPKMVEQCRRAMDQGESDLFFFRLNHAAFADITGESIDYAVMENTSKAAVVPVDMGWSDIGSWSALWQECPHDESGNVTVGDVIALDTTNSFLRSDDGRLVAAVGLSDIVVVATHDAVLVASAKDDQKVKAVVDVLNAANRDEATQAARSYRPWGWFQTMDQGDRFRVKHIQVNPGAKLSLQKHWHRSEHWVVVTGAAIVTRGEEQFMLRENESTFIPAGIMHRLENPGRVPLRIIEVQSGEYVGEDDIVREADDYGRLPTRQ